ncbi:MAG TPA: ABC transporter permease subunit [Candidatus Competibacteraceae bacterium]|nr:ABC transporter permease subunit [Candidatus Competibacteraceae bacterium]
MATQGSASAVWRWASWLLLLVLWQGLSWWLADRILPGPAAVARRIGAELGSGTLPAHLALTLGRVLASFLLAMLAGSLLGIALARWPRLDSLLDGWVVLGLNIPALVTIVLCYIWVGLNEFAAVLAVTLNKTPTVVVLLREGARAVDRQLLEVATVFSVAPGRCLLRVYLPQLLPYLLAAARTGLALIWKIVLVVELLGRSNGVGFQLHLFFQLFDITGILAYTLAFALLVVAVEGWLLRPLERRLTRWRL